MCTAADPVLNNINIEQLIKRMWSGELSESTWAQDSNAQNSPTASSDGAIDSRPHLHFAPDQQVPSHGAHLQLHLFVLGFPSAYALLRDERLQHVA